MIKLNRHPKPAFLTSAKVTELTKEYKKTGKSVWNIEEIKKPLLQSSAASSNFLINKHMFSINVFNNYVCNNT